MPSVTALRSIRIAERPNLIWVELETDDGLTGLGESFRGAQAVEAALHEQVAFVRDAGALIGVAEAPSFPGNSRIVAD